MNSANFLNVDTTVSDFRQGDQRFFDIANVLSLGETRIYRFFENLCSEYNIVDQRHRDLILRRLQSYSFDENDGAAHFLPDVIKNSDPNIDAQTRLQNALSDLQANCDSWSGESFSPEQEAALLEAHDSPGEPLVMSEAEMRVKHQILRRDGVFDSEIAKFLIQRFHCGTLRNIWILALVLIILGAAGIGGYHIYQNTIGKANDVIGEVIPEEQVQGTLDTTTVQEVQKRTEEQIRAVSDSAQVVREIVHQFSIVPDNLTHQLLSPHMDTMILLNIYMNSGKLSFNERNGVPSLGGSWISFDESVTLPLNVDMSVGASLVRKDINDIRFDWRTRQGSLDGVYGFEIFAQRPVNFSTSVPREDMDNYLDFYDAFTPIWRGYIEREIVRILGTLLQYQFQQLVQQSEAAMNQELQQYVRNIDELGDVFPALGADFDVSKSAGVVGYQELVSDDDMQALLDEGSIQQNASGQYVLVITAESLVRRYQPKIYNGWRRKDKLSHNMVEITLPDGLVNLPQINTILLD